MPKRQYPHTPGPWWVDSGAVISEKGGIAHMDRDNPATAPVERDSNAHLVAAVPALADVAATIDEEWHLAHDALKRGDRDEVFRFLCEWQDAARSALRAAGLMD